jgi:hypothetical protein
MRNGLDVSFVSIEAVHVYGNLTSAQPRPHEKNETGLERLESEIADMLTEVAE